MAPRREKTEHTPTDDNATLVLQYLQQQNRPYSAADVSANLHGRVTKVQAAKVLKDLHDRKEIESKASGKQIVYHAIQKEHDEISPEEFTSLQKTVDQLRNDVASAKNTERQLKHDLANLGSPKTRSQLEVEVKAAEEEMVALKTCITGLQQQGVAPTTETDKKTIAEMHSRWKRLVTNRKKICLDLWYSFTTVLPAEMTEKELWESLGLEGQP